MGDALIFRDVVKEYPAPQGRLRILDGVSAEIGPGETVAVTGPSGAGKSTLLNLAGSLDTPTSGEIRLGNIPVHALAGEVLGAYRRSRVGFVFQDHLLLPQLTALENVLLPTLAGPREGDPDARAAALLERVGLADRAAHRPARLSGGERQRVAIARALVNGARLLLCDEPTGNLDHDTARHIVDLFLDLARTELTTVVMVTHNLDLAGLFARRLALRAGRLVEPA